MLWNLPGNYTGFNNLTGISTDFYNNSSGQDAAYQKYFGDNGLRGNLLNWAKQNQSNFTNDYLNWYNKLPIAGAGNTGQVDPKTGQPYQSTPGSYFTAWLSQNGGPLLAAYNYLPARQRGVNAGAFTPGRLMF